MATFNEEDLNKIGPYLGDPELVERYKKRISPNPLSGGILGMTGAQAMDQATGRDKIDEQRLEMAKADADRAEAEKLTTEAAYGELEGDDDVGGSGMQNTAYTPPETDAKILGAMQAGYEAQKDAINQSVVQGQRAAAEEAGYMDQMKKENEALEEKLKAERDSEIAATEETMRYFDKEIEEISKEDVDKSRYWASKSTGEKIALGLGAILGAFGAAHNGGVNLAAQTIQKQINDDVAEQRAKIGERLDQAKEKQNLYARQLMKLKDPDLAESATRALHLSDQKIELAKIAATSKSEQQKANAALAMAELDAKANAEMAKVQQGLMKKASLQTMAQGGTASMDPMMLDPKDRALFVPGFGLAFDREGAKKMREMGADAMSAVEGIDRLLEISKTPIKSLNPKLRAESEALRSMLVGALRLQIVGPGAMTDSERKLIERVIADPAAMFSLDMSNRKSLETAKQKIKKSLENNARMNIMGYQPPKQIQTKAAFE